MSTDRIVTAKQEKRSLRLLALTALIVAAGWLLIKPGLVLASSPASSTTASSGVYVVDFGSGVVSEFASSGGGLSALSPAWVATGLMPYAAAVLPSGRNLYVVSAGFSTVSQYSVNGSTGVLSPMWPASVAVDGDPVGIAVSPDGLSVYVTNWGANSVSQFSVNVSTGALTPKSPASVPAGTNPMGVAVSPNGRSVYVTNVRGTSISQYSVNQSTGALSPMSVRSVPTGSTPEAVAVSVDGRSAYVADAADNTISQYNINASSGALTAKTISAVPAGWGPRSVTVSPSGGSVYVADYSGNAVSQFSVDPSTGGLLPKSTAIVPAGRGPAGIVVSADGTGVYVANNLSNSVSQYSVDANSGMLVADSPATLPAGNQPMAIADPPLSKAPPASPHPTSTTLTCTPSSVQTGQASACTATVTDTAPSGRTVPTGSLSFTSDSSGSFSASSCSLSGTGSSASCQVSYTPSTLGSGTHTITASYPGDSTHATSTATRAITTTNPPPPSPHSTSTALSCSPGSVQTGQASACTATVTDTAPSGRTVPTGSLSFTSDSSGSFSASSCSLSGTGSSASCQVSYTPSTLGSGTHTITASYPGDSTHVTSTATRAITVTAAVTGGGSPFTDTTNNIHVGLAFDYGTQDMHGVTTNVDYIWGGYFTDWNFGFTPPVHSVDGYIPLDVDPWPQSAAGHSLADWQRTHPDWVVYQCDGRTPAYYGSGYENVPLDFSNPAVQAWQEQQAGSLLGAGATGIGFDNVTFANYENRCGTYRNGQWTSLGYPGLWQENAKLDGDMMAWLKNMHDQLKASFPAKTITVNFSTKLSGLANLHAIAPYIDMDFDESGFMDFSGNRLSGSAWQQEVVGFQYLDSQGKAFDVNELMAASNEQAITHDQLNWALGNYLLVKGAHSYTYLYASGGGGYGSFYDRPEYHTAIGSPTSGAYQSQGVQMRNYSGGLAIVNPSSTSTYSINLPATYRDMWGQNHTSVTLAPTTAIVLLNG